MKITVDYLTEHGFKDCGGFFMKTEKTSHISIRPTKGNDSWQISVFRQSTETYEKFDESMPQDNNSMSFIGCVTEVEQIKDAMVACGVAKKTDWRKRFPFFLVRGNKFQVHQWLGDETIWTGYETTDYNQAMAEIKRRNIENNKIH